MHGTIKQLKNTQEQDRKTCVELDSKADGTTRELAQWLHDHRTYGHSEVARWLGCSEARIRALRTWAALDFPGKGPRSGDPPRTRTHGRANSTLNSLDNSEETPIEETDMVCPEVLTEDILFNIERINHNVRVWKKLAKLAALDRQTAERIDFAIKRMIQKWRLLQLTLAKKG
jgi:hypothetical protein